MLNLLTAQFGSIAIIESSFQSKMVDGKIDFVASSKTFHTKLLQ